MDGYVHADPVRDEDRGEGHCGCWRRKEEVMSASCGMLWWIECRLPCFPDRPATLSSGKYNAFFFSIEYRRLLKEERWLGGAGNSFASGDDQAGGGNEVWVWSRR